MPHLLNVWPAVSRRLENAGRVLLVFDYDGTLTPIVTRPEAALLSAEVRALLTKLSQTGDSETCRDYIVGIVSGRSLANLKELVAIPGLVYAGNHGLEIAGPGISFVHPEVRASAPALDELFGLLPGALANIPGVNVEHKGLSLTVHYRAAPDAYAGAVEEAVGAAARPFVEGQAVRLTRGKKVVEVRPNVDWHKGKAIARIRESYPDRPLPVFFGDDRTDEDGFAVVQEQGGLAVFVGPARSGTVALHQLESPAEVALTLRLLLGDEGERQRD